MLVEILVTKDCPHEDAAIDLVGLAANALDVAPRVTVIEVAELKDARQRQFVGSPTIRVAGRDVCPPPDADPSLSCRLYRTAYGASGVPDVSLVLTALKDELRLTAPEYRGSAGATRRSEPRPAKVPTVHPPSAETRKGYRPMEGEAVITPQSDQARETKRVLAFYEKSASKYDRQMRVFDRLLFRDGREWVCSQAVGDVLEIAVGTGRNLRLYPNDVGLTGIDISPAMLDIARAKARDLGRDVDLRVGDAQRLDFADASFDTVVSTLALCTIPDDRAAIGEVHRVLRPNGRFLLLEHVRSPLLPVRLGERLLDPLAVRLEADHLLREPLEHLQAVGFQVEQLERSRLGIVERLAARKPADTPSPPRPG